jgi:hypothetical protein
MGGCVQLQLMHSPHRAKTGYERAARHHTIRYIVLSIASALVSGCDDSFFSCVLLSLLQHRSMGGKFATCAREMLAVHARFVLQCNMRSRNACCTCSFCSATCAREMLAVHARLAGYMFANLVRSKHAYTVHNSCRFLFGPVCAVNCGTVLRYTKARSTAPRSNYQQMKR